jgi:hypothetical protein
MALGIIAQRLNTTLVFDRATKQITHDEAVHGLLVPGFTRHAWRILLSPGTPGRRESPVRMA